MTVGGGAGGCNIRKCWQEREGLVLHFKDTLGIRGRGKEPSDDQDVLIREVSTL